MSEQEKLAHVARLINESVKPAQTSRKPRRAAANVPTVTINVSGGDGNGIGNTIVKLEKLVTRTIAKPNPGVEHITESQVRKLHDLKDEIVKLEAAAKRDPATPQRVWARLNKAMDVGAMRMIPAAKFRAAEKFLQVWIGQLMDRPAVQKKEAPTVAARRIAYIQTNMKKLGIEDRVRDYMESRFGVRSLKDLPDAAALERVYRYVASVKKDLAARAAPVDNRPEAD